MKDLSKTRRGESGFTLLELLVVVTILAIIGGGLLAAFSGKETDAAQGSATHAIAGVHEALNVFQVTEKKLPNNLESLACIPFNPAYDAAAYAALTVNNASAPDTTVVGEGYKFGGQSNVPGVGGGLGLNIAGKFSLRKLTAAEATALSNAGVTNLRYVVTAACDNDVATVDPTAMTVGGTTAALGAGTLVTADMPNHAFEDPRPNTTTSWHNRGRGFSAPVLTGAPVMVWNPDGPVVGDGYNNKKVGAAPTDVLIGLGIGEASEIVGTDLKGALAKAPFYGQVGKDKYAHYVALVNISQGTPFVQAVVDARGDFLDEEIAEFQNQKL